MLLDAPVIVGDQLRIGRIAGVVLTDGLIVPPNEGVVLVDILRIGGIEMSGNAAGIARLGLGNPRAVRFDLVLRGVEALTSLTQFGFKRVDSRERRLEVSLDGRKLAFTFRGA